MKYDELPRQGGSLFPEGFVYDNLLEAKSMNAIGTPPSDILYINFFDDRADPRSAQIYI